MGESILKVTVGVVITVFAIVVITTQVGWTTMVDFFFHPDTYNVPNIDQWIRNWGSFLDQFVRTNQWFCAAVGFIFGWLVFDKPMTWPELVGKVKGMIV